MSANTTDNIRYYFALIGIPILMMFPFAHWISAFDRHPFLLLPWMTIGLITSLLIIELPDHIRWERIRKEQDKLWTAYKNFKTNVPYR